MPTYEYRCEKCKATFERTESVAEHEAAKPRCPKCRSRKVSRIMGRSYVITSKKT